MPFKSHISGCKECGKILKLKCERDIVRKKFCSHKCRQKWRLQHEPFLREKLRAAVPRGPREHRPPKERRLCHHCKNEYKPNSPRQRFCQTCIPDMRHRGIMYRYGLSRTEWIAMFVKQQGKCAICKRKIKSKAGKGAAMVDHCHETGRIRGLLCGKCNFTIGHNSWLIKYQKEIIDYLDRSLNKPKRERVFFIPVRVIKR